MITSILVEMKGERLPITSSRGLWVLFHEHMAFHKFSFFNLFLIFEITSYWVCINLDQEGTEEPSKKIWKICYKDGSDA